MLFPSLKNNLQKYNTTINSICQVYEARKIPPFGRYFSYEGLFLHLLEGFALAGRLVELGDLELALHFLLVLAREDNGAVRALQLYEIGLCHIAATVPSVSLGGNGNLGSRLPNR